MEHQVEKEVKYLISKEDYEKIYNYLYLKYGVLEKINQVNYYLETENKILKRNKITARLRSIDNKEFEYTLKTKILTSNNLKVRNEFNYPLSKEEFQKIKTTGIKKSNKKYLLPIKDINLNEDMAVIGEMKTERTFFKIDELLAPINLDKNNYLNIEDYEIEWETEDILKANDILIKILKELNINAHESFISKNSRFQLLKDTFN